MTENNEQVPVNNKKNIVAPIAVVALAAGGFFAYQSFSGDDEASNQDFCEIVDDLDVALEEVLVASETEPDIAGVTSEDEMVGIFTDWAGGIADESDDVVDELRELADAADGDISGKIDEVADLFDDNAVAPIRALAQASSFGELTTLLGDLESFGQAFDTPEAEQLADEVDEYVAERCGIDLSIN